MYLAKIHFLHAKNGVTDVFRKIWITMMPKIQIGHVYLHSTTDYGEESELCFAQSIVEWMYRTVRSRTTMHWLCERVDYTSNFLPLKNTAVIWK